MIFIDNKYTTWYNSIISNAQARGFTSRAKAKKALTYAESHHIIPKSLGGSNCKENMVYLTAKEHFVCHHLLTEMTTGIYLFKMQKALSKMMQSNEFQQRYKVTAKLYEQIRINSGNAHSALIKGTQCGKDNPFYGKHHSEETIEYLRFLAKARPPVILDDTARLKISAKQKGVSKSQAHCDAIKLSWDKDARSGVNHPSYGLTRTETTKQKMRESSVLRWTEDERSRARATRENDPVSICPHCGRTVKGSWNYTQHTNKCAK